MYVNDTCWVLKAFSSYLGRKFPHLRPKPALYVHYKILEAFRYRTKWCQHWPHSYPSKLLAWMLFS